MYIYRVFIGNNTIYIGKTKNVKRRYNEHEYECYNEKCKNYNQYKNMTIRQLGITKEQFYDYVKYEILYENIPEEYNKKMEQLIMCLYKNWGNNLWNERNADFDEKDYQKERWIKKVVQNTMDDMLNQIEMKF